MSKEQTLEVQVKATAEQAKNSVDKLVNGLLKMGDSVQKVSTKLDANGNLISKTLTSVRKEGNKVYTTLQKIGKDGNLEYTTTTMKRLGNATSRTSGMFSKLTKAISLTGLFYGVKTLATTFLTWMSEATDRTEQLNLFNVVFKNIEKNGTKAFSNLGRSALQFQNKLNQAFGTNLTDTLKYQALFQSMGVNASIPDKYASIMSETMTKFTYDLASLYNKEETDVAEALRAGVYAGQTKPLRSYGIDVTQSSMQPLLDSLGITDRAVSELSQGEKEILRYLATLRQAKVAMGDFANTIESPANQMKVFRNQLVEAKVAFTSLFMGAFKNALPYANAFLMTIKGISNAIATMFGIRLEDYNTSVASSADAFGDLADDVDDATGKVKELKRQVLGFDQINNLTEPKNTGTDVTGGIDQRLLDAIYGYDNGMDKVRMKATEIYEKIMGWLGFIKEIDPLTGEISWKLDSQNSTMGKILNALKNIVINGKEAIEKVFKIMMNDIAKGDWGTALLMIFNGIADVFKVIKKNKVVQQILAKTLEILISFKVLKIIPFLKSVVTLVGNNLKNSLKTLVNNIGATKNKIKETNTELKDTEKTIEETSKKTSNWDKVMQGAKTALSGVVTAGIGLFTVHEAMKSIASEGANVTNVLATVVGSLSTISGFATIGSLFGPVGTAIGVAVGALATFIDGMITWNTESDKFIKGVEAIKESTNEYNSAIKDLQDNRDKTLSSIDVEFGYYNELYKELQSIVDENGKIKTGYEERAKVITTILSDALGIEIQIVDGVIQKYSDLETSIYDVINAKKAEATLNAYEAEYNKAMQEKTKRQEEYKTAVEKTKEAQDAYNKTLEALAEDYHTTTDEINAYINGEKTFYQLTGQARLAVNSFYEKMEETGISLKTATENLEKATQAEKEAGIALDNNQLIIDNYNKAIELMAGKHYDAVLEMYNNTVTFNGKTKEANDKKYKEEIKIIDRHLDDLKTRQSDYSAEEYEILVKGYELQKDALLKSKNEANKILEEKTKEAKKEALNTVNEQLKVFKEHSYEFKEASDGNMQLYVDGIASGRTITYQTMSNLVDGTIQKIKDKKMSAKEAGEFLVDGVNLGIGNSSKQKNVYSTIGSFTNNIINLFKSGLNIHSPSKTTETFGKQLLEGLNIGVNEEKHKVLNNINSFTSDIVDNMNSDLGRFVIDFNKCIRLTELNGNINTNYSIDVGDYISDKISRELANVINNQKVEVRLDAHTDEGVIIDRINQKTTQTGVCPINIPF